MNFLELMLRTVFRQNYYRWCLFDIRDAPKREQKSVSELKWINLFRITLVWCWHSNALNQAEMIAQNTFDQQMSMCLSLHEKIDVANHFIVCCLFLNRKQYLLDTLSKCISFFFWLGYSTIIKASNIFKSYRWNDEMETKWWLISCPKYRKSLSHQLHHHECEWDD